MSAAVCDPKTKTKQTNKRQTQAADKMKGV